MRVCLLGCLLVGCARSGGPDGASIRSMADLDRAAAFHFVVFSDNKGESPRTSVEFARMVRWTRAGDAAFAVGLGDHVKYGWENSFLSWIRNDPWWRTHAFLNVADGENEYFGAAHRQDQYGAGAPLLEGMQMSAHADLVWPDPWEYYGRIRVGDWTVHLIQLHFSDEPEDPSIAFPPRSRAWLMKVLDDLPKGPTDLVVVCAHSRGGSWDRVLTPDRRRRLLAKADLVFSATTHRYRAWVPEGFGGGQRSA